MEVTKAMYEYALQRIEELLPVTPDCAPEEDPRMAELAIVSGIVEEYENIHYPIQQTTTSLQVPPECADRIQRLVSFLIEKEVKGEGSLQAALIDAACMLVNSVKELESRERSIEEEGFLTEKKEHIKTFEEFFGFFPLEGINQHELNYYALYLRNYLTEEEDPRINNKEFIDGRADAAAAEYEIRRLEGMSVDQAQESAMKVLMQDL